MPSGPAAVENVTKQVTSVFSDVMVELSQAGRDSVLYAFVCFKIYQLVFCNLSSDLYMYSKSLAHVIVMQTVKIIHRV